MYATSFTLIVSQTYNGSTSLLSEKVNEMDSSILFVANNKIIPPPVSET